MAGLWELPGSPGYEAVRTSAARRQIEAACFDQLGRSVRVGRLLGRVKHTVLNRCVDLEVRAGRLVRGLDPDRPEVRVLSSDGADPPPLTAACRKALHAAGRL